jgi:cell division control protein 7
LPGTDAPAGSFVSFVSMSENTGETKGVDEYDLLNKACPDLSVHYKVLGKIGEGSQNSMIDQGVGTFSSVYKAVDKMHCLYRNDWKLNSTKLVALKRLYVTSAPERILSELKILHTLR